MTKIPAYLLALGIITSSSPAVADAISIKCGETAYWFHPEKNFLEMVDGNELVDWQYDGEWLRLTSRTNGKKIAFSSKNGYRLNNGKQEDAGCIFKDIERLKRLPLSEGAQLRLAFLDLSIEQRKELQSNLSQDGLYNSTIDGLWGSGTEAAIISFAKLLQNNSSPIDFKSETGASYIIQSALGVKASSSTCSSCNIDLPTPKTVKTQAEIFKSAGVNCRKTSSALGGHDGGRTVMLYIRESEWTFDKEPSVERRLRSLLSQYPNHPALNWQAGWLSFIRNDFENTINYLQKSASQGEPNAAFILAFIAAGMLNGEDSLKPDHSSKLNPINLAAATQCLESVLNSEDILVYDGGMYQSQFRELASEYLSALYMHDLEYLYDDSSANNKIDYTGVAYNPIRSLEIANTLDKDKYRILINKANAAAQKRRKEEQKEQAEKQRRHEEALRAKVPSKEELEKKCNGYSSIKGICWSLSLQEMRSVLASKNYRNKPSDLNTFIDQNGSKISLNDSSVVFECGTLNACDLSLRELAKQIQRGGLVTGSMEFDSNFSGGYVQGVSSNTNSLCGRGQKGEKICALETTTAMGALSFKSTSVVLAKGIVGKDLSFD